MNFTSLISTSKNSFFNKTEDTITICLFILLWIYLFLRGMYLPLMHDEIATFYFYVQSGVIFPPEAHYDANNHVLNSLLSHWSYQIFGSSPLAIRLPNVLSFALYFFAVKGIAGRIEQVVFRWSFLLSVTMSYFIFEYFSETRGYGISMAFLLAAIFQYIRLTESNKAIHILWIGLLLWLSTCANLTILISAIILYFLMLIHSILKDFKTFKKRFLYKIILLVLTGLPFLILVQWSFKLKELGLLYYGSLDGFYSVTIQSLFEVFVGSYERWMGVLITLFFVFVLTHLILSLFKEKKVLHLISGVHVLGILLIGSVIIINLLALILKVNFPEDRAGMYLFIYISGASAFTLSKWSKRQKWLSLMAVVFLYFPFSFIAQLNLRQASFWVDARNSQPIYDQVKNLKSDFKFPLIVGGYATQELCWYYMNHQDGGKRGRLHWTNHPATDADVQLICPCRMENPMVRELYDSTYYDQAADLILWKRKEPLKKILEKTVIVEPVKKTKSEYYGLLNLAADSFINKTIYIGVEMTLDADAEPFRSRLVATADQEAEPKNLVYEFIQLDWLRKSWKGEENNVLQGTLIHQVPENAESISFYLWNPDTTTFSIRNGKCYLYELK